MTSARCERDARSKPTPRMHFEAGTIERVHNAGGAIAEFIARGCAGSATHVLVVPTPVADRDDSVFGREAAAQFPVVSLRRLRSASKKIGTSSFLLVNGDAESARMPMLVARLYDRLTKSNQIQGKFEAAMKKCVEVATNIRGGLDSEMTVFVVDERFVAFEDMRKIAQTFKRVHFLFVSKRVPAPTSGGAATSTSTSTSASASASASAAAADADGRDRAPSESIPSTT